jgi:ABC-type glutathione transport system ATPase component
MAINLTRFQIGRLHGHRTIDLRLDDNQLILVGENGSGKTTVINILYHFLARQWRRLAEYEFAWVRADIDGHEVEVTSEYLQSSLVRKSRHRRLPRRIVEQVEDLLMSEGHEALLEEPERIAHLARRQGIPMSLIYDFLGDSPATQLDLLHEGQRRTALLSELVEEEVLYLPTYRRIEQDLRAVFPDLDERVIQERIERRRARTGFVELVEFGMEDVERDIERVLVHLREQNRESLSRLTTTFLRDVIGGRYEDVTAESLEEVDIATIESVFSRVDEGLLPGPARLRLVEIVQRIQGEQELEVEERIAAHFLLSLSSLHKRQQALENDINTFVATCNRYLVGKQFRYDGSRLTLDIDLTRSGRSEGGAIALRDLSSGEKQIVSLFSHLLLSEQENFFILIDEPELSLSVPWQQTFLPDILDTGRCTGLIAVTHSPFIFDNELDRYSHNLAEFWVEG